jgi:hypothetical protein
MIAILIGILRVEYRWIRHMSLTQRQQQGQRIAWIRDRRDDRLLDGTPRSEATEARERAVCDALRDAGVEPRRVAAFILRNHRALCRKTAHPRIPRQAQRHAKKALERLNKVIQATVPWEPEVAGLQSGRRALKAIIERTEHEPTKVAFITEMTKLTVLDLYGHLDQQRSDGIWDRSYGLRSLAARLTRESTCYPTEAAHLTDESVRAHLDAPPYEV